MTVNTMDNPSIQRMSFLLAKYTPVYAMSNVQEQIERCQLSEKQIAYAAMDMKDPTIAIILSVLAGTLAIDRFYIGDIGLGVAKLLTCGGLGIWWLVDLFLIMNRTKEKNYQLFMQMTDGFPDGSTSGLSNGTTDGFSDGSSNSAEGTELPDIR